MSVIDVLVYFTSFAFVWYGIMAFTSAYMISEFERYGLPKFRKLVGLLEILGGLGLFIGTWIEVVFLLSAAGLSLLMVLGFATRVYIRDSVLQSTPALFFALLNAYFVYVYFTGSSL